jgi:hypothetical protein
MRLKLNAKSQSQMKKYLNNIYQLQNNVKSYNIAHQAR